MEILQKLTEVDRRSPSFTELDGSTRKFMKVLQAVWKVDRI